MDKTFWNERFAEPGYMYGNQPNDFLKEHAYVLKESGKVLCLAEGEGRNAVFLASLGYDVSSVDFSDSGLKKTQILAAEHNVSVRTVCADLIDYNLQQEAWDGMVMIFGHFSKELRTSLFQRIESGLKKGGTFLMEVYAKEQLSHGTGGPKSIEFLYDQLELEEAFRGFSKVAIQAVTREIKEGNYHHGISSTLQVIATK